MGVFDLKGSSNGWNYSDKTKAGYAPTIEGTVVEISNPQAIDYVSKQPKFWPDGNPIRNLRVTLKGRSGRELSWVFSPKSLSAEACLKALDPAGSRDYVSIEELLGKFVRISTEEGVYNQAHPRPWEVTVLGDGDIAAVRGLVDLSTMPQQAPQQEKPAPTVMAAAQQRAAQALGFGPAPATVPSNDPVYDLYAEDIPF